MNQKPKFITILFSPTGGTKKVADILAESLRHDKESVEVDLCDNKADFSKSSVTIGQEDIALIAVPSYGGHVPAVAVERMAHLQGNHARAILVCVYGNRAYDNTLAELQDIASKAGFRVIAAVAALAEHSVARQVAAGRPDAEDAECLKQMAEQIQEKLQAGNMDIPKVPGEVVERKAANGQGMAPSAADSCIKCGLCAARCPVGAIDPDTLKVDAKKCISCMRCIAVCPKQARKLNVIIDSLGGVALSVLCKKRKENELFL